MSKSISVGVMGFSQQKFDLEKATRNLGQAFDIIQVLKPPLFDIEIVSGLTKLGIPALAYDLAAKRGWRTTGIACAKAKEYEQFPCDNVYIVGDSWGDESPVFLDHCDLFIRVGGGKQSSIEITMAKAMGKPVLEFDLEAIP